MKPPRSLLLLVLLLLIAIPAMADPVLLAVQSRKIHGSAGIFNLPLAKGVAIDGPITVEPRAIMNGHLLVFQFDSPINSVGSATARDRNGAQIAGVIVDPVVSGSEIGVALTNIRDNLRANIVLTGINGTTDVSVAIGFLVGDVNGSQAVGADDIGGVKARSGQAVNGGNFLFDLNLTGQIGAADIAAAKAHLGYAIPLTPATLNVNFAGAGGGSVSSTPGGIACTTPTVNCRGDFNQGSNVTLTAAADGLSAFAGWSGACSGTSASTQVVVSGGNTCTATFTALPQVTLTVARAGGGNGSVTSSPAGINCGATCAANFVQNAMVTLTAITSPGSVFSGWSGACSGNAASVTIALAAAATCTASFGAGVPSGAHPRLWLADPVTLTRLKAAVTANSAEWSRLKSFCDNNTLPTFEYQGDEQYRFAANFSLCYRLVKETAGAAAAATYASKAIAVLQGTVHPLLNFTDYSTDSGYGIRNYVPAMALIFDWLYDSPALTPALKTAIIGRIQNWMDFYATSGYAANEPISNYNSGYLLGSVLGAIAVYGESAQATALWAPALARFNTNRQTFDRLIPGGHWPEGWNYGNGVNYRYLQSATALKIATGDPAYLTAFNWLNNNVTFKPHALTPDGQFFYDDGLWSGDSIGDPRYDDIIVAGFGYGWNSTNGKIARAYINKVVPTVPLSGLLEWYAFLYYDPASQPLDLSTLPASYHAVGTGLVTMRANWTDPAATWGTVITGRYHSFQAEQDMDQGHLQIYRTAQLLIDAGHGLYGDVGFRSTPFHNTYTLLNRNDNTDRSYEGQLNLSGVCPNPLGNDPANPPANPQNLGSNPIGVNAHIDAGGYVFTSGEFSAAYQSFEIFPSSCGSIPVTWLNRSTLYLRPNVFVVFDQVQKRSNQPQLVPVMHLHFPTQPTVIAAGNRQLSLDNGGGRLQVATVLPAANTSTLQFEAFNDTTGPGIDHWHLAVRHTDASPLYQQFLTVLRAGTAVVGNTFPGIGTITGMSATGTLISGLPAAESATPIAVVFADNGTRTIPTTLQYQYPTSGSTQNYVAKLKPNTFYAVTSMLGGGIRTVTVTESTMGTKTDAAGVLAISL